MQQEGSLPPWRRVLAYSGLALAVGFALGVGLWPHTGIALAMAAAGVLVGSALWWIAWRGLSSSPWLAAETPVFLGVLVLGLMALGAGWWRMSAASAGSARAATQLRQLTGTQEIRGLVSDDPQPKVRAITFQLSHVLVRVGAGWKALPAQVLVAAPLSAPLEYGEELQLTGKLAPLGTTPAELALRRQGVLASMVYPSLSYLANPDANPLLQAIFRLRHRLAGAISSTLPEPEASTLQATVLGFRSAVSKQQQQALIDTGTVHLVVISGFKLSLLAMMLESASLLVLRRLTARSAGHVVAALLVLLAIGGYTVLTGATPSSLRAALMAGVVVLAALAGRPADRLTTLALAVLVILLVNPFELGDGGFELSALSVMGITLLAEGLAARLAALGPPLHRVAEMMRLPAGIASSVALSGQAVAEATAVSLAATLFDLPVLANNFHVVSLVSPLANLVGMPLLGPLMLFGAAGSALGAIFAPAGAVLLWIAWAVTWCLEWVIRVADLVPHAAAPVGSMPGPLVLVYYALLLAATWRITRAESADRRISKHVLASRWRLMAAAGAALFGLVLALLAARRPAHTVRVAFLAVSGEASLVQTVNGRNILIDGGLNGLETERQLGAFLAPWDHTFALALATTTRADRVGGLADIAARYHLLGLVEPDAAKPSATFTRLWQSAPRVQISAGQALDVGGGATLQLLYPPLAHIADSARADALTMVWRLRFGASSVLFAGRLPLSDWPALGPVHDDVVESTVEPPPGPLWVRPVMPTPAPAGRALVDLGQSGTWSLRLNSAGITPD